ncbi:MAG: 4Fe-4S binding protein [Desulfobacterales bacterium]|nr:MAG: 4Fe-4S binding protein [Desulfobacterales bacterium]
MNRQLYANFERCIHCHGCEVACQREHAGLSFIKVVLIEDRFAVPLVCRHCHPAPCAMACPAQALTSSGEGLMLDPAKCTGCTLCLFACPFGAMEFNTESKVAAHCDLCARRQAESRDPACILTCPSSALHCGDYASYTSQARQRISSELLRAQPLKRGEV